MPRSRRCSFEVEGMKLIKVNCQRSKVRSSELPVFGLLFLGLIFHCIFITDRCFGITRSLEGPTTIESESLDYDGATFTYHVKGKVKIKRDLTTVEADAMTYNEQTSALTAEGNVDYNEPETRIRAKNAELNLERKTGVLYDAEIFSRKDNFHITGDEIEKTGEKQYILKKASFTTCDAPLSAWCLKGSDVDAIVGDRLKAKNVTFNIRGQPVLYSPYFSASLDRERRTGLLTPTLSYIKSKGFHIEQPFYWVIADNKDATILLDEYTRRGLGEGIEYRFLDTDGSKGDFWVYHIRDKVFAKDFLDLKGVYDRDREAKITGFLNLNYINSVDFYNEYNPYVLTKVRAFLDPVSYLNLTTGRFFETTGEVSMRLGNSRLFLNSQYLVDLKSGADQDTIMQRLPEAGYFINPMKVGPAVFSLASHLSSFWRESGVSGQRIDLYPKLWYSFGNDIVISQSLGLRETAYFLSKNDGFDNSPHRESLDYTIAAHTRLVKSYQSFVHIVEPSLSYTLIPSVKSNLPLFDSTELYTKTSTVQLSLLNRFLDSHGEFLTFRITQPFDTYKEDRPFLPLLFQVAVQRPVSLRGEVSYDVNTGRVESVNSDVNITFPDKATFSLGERYNRLENILFYTAGLNYAFSRTLSAEGNFWYDARSGGLKDLIAKVTYRQQCWAVNIVVTKREKDYGVSVLFDLLGLGTVKL